MSAQLRVPGPYSAEQAADLAEIQQRIFFYGWCIDHRRFDDLDALFLPETVIHYDVPMGTKKPWSEMKSWLPGGLSQFRCTQHNMSNPMIDLTGDGATSNTYGHLIHFQELKSGEVSVMRHHTIYRDRWEKRPDGWRILARTLSNLHVDGPIHPRDQVVEYREPKPF